MKEDQHVLITPSRIVLNGKQLAVKEQGEGLLKEVYRERIGNYSKFYKMDPLCKLGFIASELILQQEGNRILDEKGTVTEQMGREDRAIILFNRNGSIYNDRDYEVSVVSSEGCFASPSLFVYTLPNIVTGEIAVRNRYYGETAFYLLPSKNEDLMWQIVEDALTEEPIQSALYGWLEYEDGNCFEADLYLLSRKRISLDDQKDIF